MRVRVWQRQEIDLDGGHAENNNYLFRTQHLCDNVMCVCVLVRVHYAWESYIKLLWSTEGKFVRSLDLSNTICMLYVGIYIYICLGICE